MHVIKPFFISMLVFLSFETFAAGELDVARPRVTPRLAEVEDAVEFCGGAIWAGKTATWIGFLAYYGLPSSVQTYGCYTSPELFCFNAHGQSEDLTGFTTVKDLSFYVLAAGSVVAVSNCAMSLLLMGQAVVRDYLDPPAQD